MTNKKMFFGWTNIKWGIKEMIKLCSNEPSYFSKKRVESLFAFLIMESGLLAWLIIELMKPVTMPIGDLVMWCSVNALVSGYNIREIQKEKDNKEIPTDAN